MDEIFWGLAVGDCNIVLQQKEGVKLQRQKKTPLLGGCISVIKLAVVMCFCANYSIRTHSTGEDVTGLWCASSGVYQMTLWAQ